MGPKVEWGGTEGGMGLTESGVRWDMQISSAVGERWTSAVTV